MDMSVDNDASRRGFRVVRATKPPAPKSPAAQASARYRARKRGENTPKRKPGPKPTTASVLREQIRDLTAQIHERDLRVRLLTERLQRQVSTMTVDRAAQDLFAVLDRDEPSMDTVERRELLGDVRAAIESRHEHWLR